MGMGHIFRCLSLSKMAAPYFDNVSFFIEEAEQSTVELVTKETFSMVSLKRSQDFFSSLEKTDLVLLDGYHFTEEYELAIKNKGCKIITIDDLQHRRFHADILINHTPGLNRSNYLTAPDTKVYLGLKYALIRREFLEAERRKKAPESLCRAFVCFGGADPENFTLKYYQYLKRNFPSTQVTLVVGPSYVHLEDLIKETKEDSQVQLRQSVQPAELIELLYNRDFAIVSASTISIECMKIGIPLYLVKTAENQQSNYTYLLEKEYAAKVEDMFNYSFSYGEKMLNNQAAAFNGNVEENLRAIFEELLICEAS